MTMILDRLLDELHTAQGPIMNSALARRLGIDESALDGMIGVLTAKGVLSVPAEFVGGDAATCSGAACGSSCVGLEKCPFVLNVPETYSLVDLPTSEVVSRSSQ
ncbi:MAG: FeoC-like transcriptional regulator [Actinomycetota bacterium]